MQHRHRAWIFGASLLGACGTGTDAGPSTAADATTTNADASADASADAGDTNGDDGPVASTTGDADTGTTAAADDTGTPGYVCAEPPSCAPAGEGPTTIELRVFGVDDEVVAMVNGLRRGFWSIPNLPGQDTGRLDISGWFTRGHNELRLLAANTGGPAAVNVQVWVDGELVLDDDCVDDACPVGVEVPLGVFYDQTVAVDSDALPCAQQLCVHGEEEGALYVDGVYTGARAPIEVMLPPGTYDVGVGSGTEDPPPDAGASFEHEGRFRQRTVMVGDAPSEVALGAADLVAPQGYRFLIVPIRNVQYTNGQTGVLADAVPGVLADAVEYASTHMSKPFAFGMVEYTADVHPVLETTVTADADGFVAIDQNALQAAGLDAAAVADHDVIVWAYSSHLADGTPVAQPPCCAWGGGSQIWMHTGWVYEPPIIYYVFIHEWLHTTEDELIHLGYSGADGVHGADEHGYASGDNGEDDFAKYYRHFMRGQIAEQGTWVGAVMGLWQGQAAPSLDPSRRFAQPVRALPFSRR